MKGFIALMSVIVISAILLALVSAASISAWYARFDTLEGGYHRAAQALAQGCAQIALLKLAQNPSYDPGADPAYLSGMGAQEGSGAAICYIKDILQLSAGASTTAVRIDAWANVGDAYSSTALSARVSTNAAPQPLAQFEQ